MTENFSPADRCPRPLLEREGDLAELDAALAEAATGEGRVVLIEGPAGIGKTVLLGELRRRARASELTVLAARGGELERGFGFGVVRQLLDAQLAAGEHRSQLLSGAARLAEPLFSVDAGLEAGDGDVAYATLHGLYWLVANLADRAPLVLAVDDVQWADEPSLRFLLHLAHRLAGLPVLIALSARSPTQTDRPELRSLLLEAHPPILRPRPMSRSAVDGLVRTGLGETATAALCRACWEATGGNPFLLTELLGELRRDGRPAAEIDPAGVGMLGPERIAGAVLLRIGGRHPLAPALARSVAILGEQATAAGCAALADLRPEQARELADALAELAVLERGEPLRFVHPVVRAAIYDDIPAGRRAQLHARAARMLAERGVDPGNVAAHLLMAEPAGDRESVATLRDAARRALAGGAPDSAVTLLRRALTEPPDTEARPHVLLELGIAEHELGDGEAAHHLREAGDAASDPVTRARAVVALAWNTHTDPRRQRDQLALYERAAADVRDHDRELALHLEGARLGGLLFIPNLSERFLAEAEKYRDLRGRTAAECLLLSFVARTALIGGQRYDTAGDLAERAASHPAFTGQGGHPLWRMNTIMCLLAAERYATAEEVLSDAVRNAERSGSLQWFARATMLRALVRHRRGDLRGAEADGRTAINPWGSDRAHAAGAQTPLLDALADLGRVDEGTVLLAESSLDGELAPVLTSILPLIARGRLRAAAGDLTSARTDLENALGLLRAVPGNELFAHDTRVALVPVLLRLGDHERACALAGDAVAAAVAVHSPRAIGGALRVAGLARGGAEGVELLRRAVDTLATSPSLLWRAEALIDLGEALRRDGQRGARDARDALRAGMDLAHRCGATPLADRAAAALRATGARPRRRAIIGADALTATERRVAELAAGGMSNKQIAQALFVTLRTVEIHLSSSYRKLEIRSREALAAALSG